MNWIAAGYFVGGIFAIVAYVIFVVWLGEVFCDQWWFRILLLIVFFIIPAAAIVGLTS